MRTSFLGGDGVTPGPGRAEKLWSDMGDHRDEETLGRAAGGARRPPAVTWPCAIRGTDYTEGSTGQEAPTRAGMTMTTVMVMVTVTVTVTVTE
ncbi:hypothetical protein Ssi03_45670 [Sphaerisporangium siamense]|nr:hypothetical protein Ssi03_45670 [Sphaerisporangium siamense]